MSNFPVLITSIFQCQVAQGWEEMAVGFHIRVDFRERNPGIFEIISFDRASLMTMCFKEINQLREPDDSEYAHLRPAVLHLGIDGLEAE